MRQTNGAIKSNSQLRNKQSKIDALLHAVKAYQERSLASVDALAAGDASASSVGEAMSGGDSDTFESDYDSETYE